MKASDLMTEHEVWACAETADAQQVAQMMWDHNVGAIPVLDSDGRLEGIVTDRDLCCKIIATGSSCSTPVRQIMSGPAYSVQPDAELETIESIMREHRIRRVPVVDGDDRLKGFISMGDIACYVHTPLEEHELIGVLEAVRAESRD